VEPRFGQDGAADNGSKPVVGADHVRIRASHDAPEFGISLLRVILNVPHLANHQPSCLKDGEPDRRRSLPGDSAQPCHGPVGRDAADCRVTALTTELALKDSNDSCLVALVAEGNEDALREIVCRYGQAVFGLARRILHDESLAQDIAQEVFVGLWQRHDRFDATRGSLRNLLMSQTHGRSVDLIRSRHARQAREEKAVGDQPIVVIDIDAALMSRTTATHVRQALLQIPSQEAVAIELAYFGANTYKQVAVLLELPEGTVKARIRSGLRHLNELLREHDAS
jgi:RNA polymerase sigma-70 factor, ECF subfamily